MKLLNLIGNTALLTSLTGCGVISDAANGPKAIDQPLFKLSEGVVTPESVYFDPQSARTFFSNINGSPLGKDGNGYISTLTIDARGVPQSTKLVDGLNAPKGLRAQDGILYVTDIDQLVSIDIASGKVLNKLTIDGAKFLNDTAIDAQGNVYVSDTFGDKIYQVTKGKVSVFAEGPELEAPNGLVVVGNKLFVAGWGTQIDPATFGVKAPGHLASYDLITKARQLVTKEPLGNLDGLEVLPSGDFLVSDWVKGKIYQVSAQGKIVLRFDGLQNPADIGLKGQALLIPSMSANQILAISL